MPRCEDCRGVGGQNCQGDLILCRRCVDRRRLPSVNKEPATFTKPKDVAGSSPNPIQGSCHQEVNSAAVPAIEDEVGRNVNGECDDRRHGENDQIECERCLKWMCAPCMKMPKAMLNALIKYRSLHWYCPTCEPLAVDGARSEAVNCTSDEVREKRYDEVMIASIAEKTATAIAVSIESKVKDLTLTSANNSLQSQGQGQRQSYADVTRNLSRFTGTINKIVAGTSTPQSSSCNPQDSREVVQLVDEYIEREKRRKNLVVFNVPEDVKDDATDSKLSDKELFKDIVKKEFNLIPKVQAAYRLGRKTSVKPRPLLIRMDNDDTSSRALILRRAKDLRNSSRWSRVYIVPDMTPNEREADRKLRQELKSRREAGEENLVIRRGRIVCTQTPRESRPRDSRDDHSQA
ncbi:hypothetical protein Bbelb_206040 [Branchiostoma belcheri]|nr:hypothetical protein Bbelb_206040 [Branchiostoma belcheri]